MLSPRYFSFITYLPSRWSPKVKPKCLVRAFARWNNFSIFFLFSFFFFWLEEEQQQILKGRAGKWLFNMNRVLLFSERSADPRSWSLTEGRVRGLKESAEDFASAEQCHYRANVPAEHTVQHVLQQHKSVRQTERRGQENTSNVDFRRHFLLKTEVFLEANRSVP